VWSEILVKYTTETELLILNIVFWQVLTRVETNSYCQKYKIISEFYKNYTRQALDTSAKYHGIYIIISSANEENSVIYTGICMYCRGKNNFICHTH
jgi:hypothetical protein